MIDDEPDWITEKNRKEGDTTLEQCGWCEHRGGGSYRYDCMISGSCDLLKSYRNDVKWNTPCIIKKMGKGDIDNLIEHKEYEIDSSKISITSYQKNIKSLRKISKKADDKPVSPDKRKHDHFNIGDNVMVLNEEKKEWELGTVVNGYRHHDGCVSFDLQEKNNLGCGYAVPSVMLLTEYEWFARHLNRFADWVIEACEKDYNGNKFKMTDFPIPQIKEGEDK
jgi:hypothetical protein